MINPQDYKIISDYIAEAQDCVKDSLSSIVDMRRTLLNTDINELDKNRTELLGYINATYSHIYNKHYNFQRDVKHTVKVLNEHILKNYNYDTIDSFLEDNNLNVMNTFAVISNETGYPITHIE